MTDSKPKMLNVPDDKYNLLATILLHTTTEDEIKVKLDLNGFNYDKKNELNFLKWLWNFAEKYNKGKCYLYDSDKYVLQMFEDKYGKIPESFDEITSFRNSIYFNCKELYKVWYDFNNFRYPTSVKSLKKMILAYAKLHIDSLVSVDQANRWIKMKLTMRNGKNSILGELKDTLLYYWIKAHPNCKLK